MSEHRVSWGEIVTLAHDVAMDYRRKNEDLCRQIGEKDRAIEIYKRLIADFERQKGETK